MGISDLFNSSKLKEENQRLKQLVTPEMQNAIDIQQHIDDLHQQENSISESITQKSNELDRLNEEINQAKSQLVVMNDAILFQDFALYEPRYDFCNSEEYKEKLQNIRDQQSKV